MSFRARWKGMNAYDIHKTIINEYVLTKKGSTKLLKRDASNDKRDIDVIRENHKFLWDEEDSVDTWEKKLAKKYYDRLFKEYCVGDLTHFKENKIGLRWRTENELINGKGQFSCGEKHCTKKEELKTWEVNFAYVEDGTKKNALVKIRLCPKCSRKLNYRYKRKEVKRLQDKKAGRNYSEASVSATASTNAETAVVDSSSDAQVWKDNTQPCGPNKKSQDSELDDFLEDLFL